MFVGTIAKLLDEWQDITEEEKINKFYDNQPDNNINFTTNMSICKRSNDSSLFLTISPLYEFYVPFLV